MIDRPGPGRSTTATQLPPVCYCRDFCLTHLCFFCCCCFFGHFFLRCPPKPPAAVGPERPSKSDGDRPSWRTRRVPERRSPKKKKEKKKEKKKKKKKTSGRPISGRNGDEAIKIKYSVHFLAWSRFVFQYFNGAQEPCENFDFFFGIFRNRIKDDWISGSI